MKKVMLFPTLLILVMAGISVGQTKPATYSAADAAEIERLIEQLGSEKPARREDAQKALVKIGPPAVAALEHATADKDAERATRAAEALKAIRLDGFRAAMDKLSALDWGQLYQGGKPSLVCDQPSAEPAIDLIAGEAQEPRKSLLRRRIEPAKGGAGPIVEMTLFESPRQAQVYLQLPNREMANTYELAISDGPVVLGYLLTVRSRKDVTPARIFFAIGSVMVYIQDNASQLPRDQKRLLAVAKNAASLLLDADSLAELSKQTRSRPLTSAVCGMTLQGRLLDQPGGKPLGNFPMRLTANGHEIKTRTNEQGWYRFDGIVPASWDFLVRPIVDDGENAWRQSAVGRPYDSSATSGAITLEDAYLKLTTITVKVLDSADGKAVAGADVIIPHATSSYLVKSGAKGIFKVLMSPQVFEFTCFGTRDRYMSSQRQQVTIESGKDQTVEVKLDSAPAVTGRVLLPDGKGAAKAKISVDLKWTNDANAAKLIQAARKKYPDAPKFPQPGMDTPWINGYGSGSSTIADAEGKFTIYLRPPSPRIYEAVLRIRLTAISADGSSSGQIEATTTTVKVDLEPQRIALEPISSATSKPSTAPAAGHDSGEHTP